MNPALTKGIVAALLFLCSTGRVMHFQLQHVYA